VGLANVRILDSTWLLGTVPAGIASGSYDLLLVNPPAAETVVREAYLVRDPPGSPAAGGGQTIVIPVAAQRTTLDP
jgi:hypothetical protein